MSVGAAIVAFFRGYAEFTGTARRSEFWWAILFTALVSAGLSILSGGLSLSPMDSNGRQAGDAQPWLVSLWGLATLVPTLAVTVRRLRDAGYGWPFAFFLLVPLAGLAVVAYLCAQPSTPRLESVGAREHAPRARAASARATRTGRHPEG